MNEETKTRYRSEDLKVYTRDQLIDYIVFLEKKNKNF